MTCLWRVQYTETGCSTAVQHFFSTQRRHQHSRRSPTYRVAESMFWQPIALKSSPNWRYFVQPGNERRPPERHLFWRHAQVTSRVLMTWSSADVLRPVLGARLAAGDEEADMFITGGQADRTVRKQEHWSTVYSVVADPAGGRPRWAGAPNRLREADLAAGPLWSGRTAPAPHLDNSATRRAANGYKRTEILPALSDWATCRRLGYFSKLPASKKNQL